jgi:hypothetical protein
MLHIVQGGIENGDKAWLERAAKRGLSHSWVNPKRTRPGDRAIIYIAGIGFFATATFKSEAIPSKNWANRYSSRMGNVRLIRPPVSLGVIRRKLPRFKWADYPRSITTPDSTMETKLLRLVADRRRLGAADISENQFVEASLAELRAAAFATREVEAGAAREAIVGSTPGESSRRVCTAPIGRHMRRLPADGPLSCEQTVRATWNRIM